MQNCGITLIGFVSSQKQLFLVQCFILFVSLISEVGCSIALISAIQKPSMANPQSRDTQDAIQQLCDASFQFSKS
jgi:hypothetical protein